MEKTPEPMGLSDLLHLVRSCFSLTPPSALGHASASSVIAHAKAARPMRLTPSPNACASAGHAQPLGAGGRCQRHRRGTVCGIFHCGVGRPGVPAIRRRPQGGGEDGAGQARVPRRGCRVREGRPCVQEGAPGAAEGTSGLSAVHRVTVTWMRQHRPALASTRLSPSLRAPSWNRSCSRRRWRGRWRSSPSSCS